MSLTGTHHVFAGVHEHAINVFLQAFFTARPHYLTYGTVPFIAATTVSVTNVPTIAFPGIPGGISYVVQFAIPSVDLFPPDSGSPNPLPPGPGQFSIGTKVRIIVGCEEISIDKQRMPSITPLETEIDLWARGHLIVFNFGAGNGFISFQLDDIKLVGIAPASLEAVLECVIRMMLQAALSNVQLPFHALTMGAFALILQQGPEIANDQVQLFGDI